MLMAVRANEPAAADAEVRDLLAHVRVANRFWLATLRDRPFHLEGELRAGHGPDELILGCRRTHLDESAWVEGLSDSDLGRVFESPHFPGNRSSLAEALSQVCPHPQGHR